MLRNLLDKLAPGVAPKINLAGDAILLGVAATVATSAPGGDLRWQDALAVGTLALIVWVLGSRAVHQYDAGKGHGLIEDLALTSVLLVVVTAVVPLPGILAPTHLPPVRVITFVSVLWPGVLWLRAVIPGVRALADAPIDVLVLGAGPLARHTGAQIREETSHRRVLGYLAFPHEEIDSRLDAPLLGTVDRLEEVLAAGALDEVYLAGNSLRHGDAMQAAIHVCECFGTPFALPVSQFRFSRARPASARATADGYIHYLSVENKPAQMVMKRIFDILVSSVVLALLSPLFLVVALLIKITSRGPVFFKQERVGRHGRPFNMLKFRSMVANAEELKASLLNRNEQSGPVFKIERDPRVTAVGRLIRKYSIDELPQFINVLRGEMSIVGPRPPLAGEVAMYEAWQRRRLSVPPGITCVWQVSGRNHTSFETWMYLDMQYIDHWSLSKDIKLILRTIPAMFSGRGAS